MRERQVITVAKYEFLLLDADGTLFDFLRCERAALRDALRLQGIDPTEEMIAKYSEINDNYWKMLERGEITKSELRTARFATFCDYYGFGADVARLSVDYTDALSTKGIMISGAPETCRALAARCKLYIVTNGIATVQHRRLSASPLFAFLKDVFISEELGAEKPHIAYFDAVAARIPGFAREKALIVGDSLSSDIRGGVNAGIDTCWFNPAGKKAPADLPITHEIRALEELIPLVLGE
jgi:2-haloacid dehalogenase